MQKATFSICLLAMLLASCAATGPVRTEVQTVDTACEWVGPIYIAADDKLTDATARGILAHNRAWVAACKNK
jgi:predicted small lipoprotein YifL